MAKHTFKILRFSHLRCYDICTLVLKNIGDMHSIQTNQIADIRHPVYFSQITIQMSVGEFNYAMKS